MRVRVLQPVRSVGKVWFGVLLWVHSGKAMIGEMDVLRTLDAVNGAR